MTTPRILSIDQEQLFSVNKRVGLSPFPEELTSVRTTAKGTGPVKVGQIENKANIVFLKVVMNALSETLPIEEGNYVAVKASSYAQPWAKEKFKIEAENGDSLEFILVPEYEILFV